MGEIQKNMKNALKIMSVTSVFAKGQKPRYISAIERVQGGLGVKSHSHQTALLFPLHCPWMWERQRKVKRNYSLCLNDSE